MTNQPGCRGDPQRHINDHHRVRPHCRSSTTLLPSYSVGAPLHHMLTYQFLRLNPTGCERAGDSSLDLSSSSSPALPSSALMTLEDVRREKARIQAELDRLENQYPGADDRCDACLYTGVATCAGLASYFAHLAWNDAAVKPRHRPFLGVLSAGWVVAGAYRWSLG